MASIPKPRNYLMRQCIQAIYHFSVPIYWNSPMVYTYVQYTHALLMVASMPFYICSTAILPAFGRQEGNCNSLGAMQTFTF